MRDGSHRHLFDSGVISMVLGRSPKFGALVMTAPTPAIGGRSVVVIGLITATAARIWVEAPVDFSQPHNLIATAVTLMTGSKT